jgi:peptide-methionine (S)-S-oxide reductase
MPKATLAMGCFWRPEKLFRAVDGVTDTAVGYAGGHVQNPTYRQVCQGDTGHAEVVQIEYDTNAVSYEQLLDVFWANHDPSTRDRQGPDRGSQYRCAIFTHDDAQAEAARASLARHQETLTREVATRIEPLEAFYKAEEHHQRYLERTGSACAQ